MGIAAIVALVIGVLCLAKAIVGYQDSEVFYGFAAGICAILATVFFIVWSIQSDNEFKAECKDAGGEIITTKQGKYSSDGCFKVIDGEIEQILD